jgi:hypothetical protein
MPLGLRIERLSRFCALPTIGHATNSTVPQGFSVILDVIGLSQAFPVIHRAAVRIARRPGRIPTRICTRVEPTGSALSGPFYNLAKL